MSLIRGAKGVIQKTTSGRWRWRIEDKREGVLAQGRVAYEKITAARAGYQRFVLKIALCPYHPAVLDAGGKPFVRKGAK